MNAIPPELARSLAPRYTLNRVLGVGGMATVFLAEDARHQRRVAVKVLEPELAAALGAERFLREITTTANLRHPNILPLFDSGDADGRLFYVMPYVEGETLRSRLTREGPLPTEDALRIADEVADALHYAHTRGVIHRDIKPENILLENDHAVVADFGIARAASPAGDEKLTMVGLALGTPHYMSPEQGTGDEVDARSDLYALACVTYEMLAGRPPFDAPTAMGLVVKHISAPVPSLSELRPEVSPTLAAAIERALAKAPDGRYATLQEWRAALKPAVGLGMSGVTPVVPVIDTAPPGFATPLLGRDESLNAACEELRGGTRVLTITGYGGTGKTRFASALQRRAATDFPGGTAFVSLASVTDPAQVMASVGATLGIAEAHGRSAVDAVATVVGNRRVLLVLDNLEQVVEAAEDIASLVARCPRLQIVATSRRPLRIGAETEMALPPLDLPALDATVDMMRACASVTLFAQRAEKVKPGFEITTANGAAVAAICRRLDGLPLALELAAARVRILEPAALLLRLDNALDLLTSGDRDLPMRQRTLRATISWSYSLLTPDEQRLLRRVSVFHEGWTLEGLERVCYADADRWRALDELASLAEKGLVRVGSLGERYSLLETIRAFAAEQLHAGGEVEPLRDAHAEYFLSVAREVHEGIQGTTQREAMQRARVESANAFAALGWLVARAKLGDSDALERGMQMCGWSCWYWHIVGLHLIATDTVDTLIAMALEGPPTRGRALASFASGMMSAASGDLAKPLAEWSRLRDDGRALAVPELACLGLGCSGYALLGMGRFAEAEAPLDEAIEQAHAAKSEFLVALFLTLRGLHSFVTGDVADGIARVERARLIQSRIGDCEGGGMALSFLAQMHFAKGELPRAMELYRESEVDFSTVGDKPELARVQGESGYVELAAGNISEARRNFQRALRTSDEIGSARGIGQALYGIAATEAAAGNAPRALTLAAAAQVMSERVGVVIDHPMAPGLVARIEALRASVPSDALTELVERGRTLTPAAALALAVA